MKKIYQSPATRNGNICIDSDILSGSQVQTGGKLGNEYYEGDVSYGRNRGESEDQEEQVWQNGLW